MNPDYAGVKADPDLMQAELAALSAHMRAHAQREGLALTHLLVQHHTGVCRGGGGGGGGGGSVQWGTCVRGV